MCANHSMAHGVRAGCAGSWEMRRNRREKILSRLPRTDIDQQRDVRLFAVVASGVLEAVVEGQHFTLDPRLGIPSDGEHSARDLDQRHQQPDPGVGQPRA